MSDVRGLPPQCVSALAEGFTGGGGAAAGLRRLCDVAVDVSGASAAAVLFTGPGRSLSEIVSTDSRAHAVARAELDSGRGPSVDAFRSGGVVRAGEAGSSAEAWPEFAASRAGSGYAGAVSLPLGAAGQRFGALSLLRERAGAFSEQSVAGSSGLAGLAAALLTACRRTEQAQRLVRQLRGAMTTRLLIEQAKGLLAERHELSPEAAFERLRRHARDHNLRIHGVAAAVARGELQL